MGRIRRPFREVRILNRLEKFFECLDLKGMKQFRIFIPLMVCVAFLLSGCSRTREENGVTIEKGGWFGSVEQQVVEDTEGS